MLWLLTLILTTSIANPILQDLDDYITADDSATNNLDVLSSSNLETTAVGITQGECMSDTFSDKIDDNLVVYRRDKGYCRSSLSQQDYGYNSPLQGYRTTPSAPAEKNPYDKVKYDSSDNVCTEKEHPIPVTCGGPERLSDNGPHNIAWSPYVINCIPGKFPLLVVALNGNLIN